MRKTLKKALNWIFYAFVLLTIVYLLRDGNIFSSARSNITEALNIISQLLKGKTDAVYLSSSDESIVDTSISIPSIKPDFYEKTGKDGITRSCQIPNYAMREVIEEQQSKLLHMADVIKELEAEIKKGRDGYNTMNKVVDIYNKDVKLYQSKFVQVEDLRRAFNEQVDKYIACLNS
ncbi:MAG: hypothetical protein KBC17_00840 [Candidatus Pacebacteria bacterium]|nr:hypothetical protein [Candidatus Paceibacterota bacterium]